MAVNYTVIFQVRQWFGDKAASDGHETIFGDWQTAPFVGVSKDYNFECPHIDRTQEAVLQFQALGVDNWSGNLLQINGQDIFGGLTRGPMTGDEYIGINGKPFALWTTSSLIVQKNILSTKNTLHIEADVSPWTGAHDNFIVDNVVLFYKTRDSLAPDSSGQVVTESRAET